MINADCSVAWTTRFSLNLDKESEFKFTECLTRIFNKGFLIYYYREHLLGNLALDEKHFLSEVQTTTNVIARYPRGYHLYKHLLWVVDHSKWLQHESLLKWSENVVLTDPTDYTAFSLRRYIFEKGSGVTIMNGNYINENRICPDPQLRQLQIEFVWCLTIVHCIPGKEAVWLYTFCVASLLDVINQKRSGLFDFKKYFDSMYEKHHKLTVSRTITGELYYSEIPFSAIETLTQFIREELHNQTNEIPARMVVKRLHIN
ncbi:hypothetical protein EIN_284450 [Entamoeba invadens IP1]|uniref:Geranylgeranyl transferase type-2 subunit alpha n=1 Tax=Entamoeba invadens IP1 TaxID=370355 RepID=L7FKP7_ENTIV|nr:hypothetical protein EIN_284450 [Entamoeba invadens IP1]ELP84869.1 hypothetical protein EIN_284450 [Entamoeba invadens IP1]|eukprot:XP_004184215.1 hypothetical protein EIN_284450 [Entamoeba invadens IP1]